MTPENWKLVLAFGGLFLTTVTGPILWAIIAESRRIRAEMIAMKSELKMDIAASKSELKLEISEINVKMVEMEARLNQRIDTRLTHR